MSADPQSGVLHNYRNLARLVISTLRAVRCAHSSSNPRKLLFSIKLIATFSQPRSHATSASVRFLANKYNRNCPYSNTRLLRNRRMVRALLQPTPSQAPTLMKVVWKYLKNVSTFLLEILCSVSWSMFSWYILSIFGLAIRCLCEWRQCIYANLVAFATPPPTRLPLHFRGAPVASMPAKIFLW